LFPDCSVVLTKTISLTLDVYLRLRGRRKLALFDNSDRDSTHCGWSMGIGAALLGYPAWAIPLIALLGAGGAVVAVRLIG
jgi:hypothetical protein